jgi:hypothetical protein
MNGNLPHDETARAALLFARIDFAIRRDDVLTPEERLTASLAAASARSAAETGDGQ